MTKSHYLARLRNWPWPASLLVLLLYTTWALVQSFADGHRPAAVVPATPDSAATAMRDLVALTPHQIGLLLLLTGIVGLLGWWRQVGIADLDLGDLRFALGPSLSAVPLLVLGILLDAYAGVGYLGAGSLQGLVGVGLVSLIVGYTQELMFRGILFHGAAARFSPVVAVILTALLYSLVHSIPLVGDQELGVTVSQALHAATDGFLYGAVRLTTGSLWPTVLVRGLWELSMASAHSGLQHLPGATAQTLSAVDAGGITVKPLQFLLPLLNGSLMLWNWTRRQSRARMDMMAVQ